MEGLAGTEAPSTPVWGPQVTAAIGCVGSFLLTQPLLALIFSRAERARQDQHSQEQLRGQQLSLHQRADSGRGHGAAGMKCRDSAPNEYVAFSYSIWGYELTKPTRAGSFFALGWLLHKATGKKMH